MLNSFLIALSGGEVGRLNIRLNIYAIIVPALRHILFCTVVGIDYQRCQSRAVRIRMA
jgi:hypothetical protein